ncbi:hypothetical protein RYX36_035182 [Vicia faba]
MTCSDLITEMDREDEPTIMPRVIGGFIKQTFLFKIDVKNDVKSGFKHSFRVKNVCADKDIITKFKYVVKVDKTLLHNFVDFEDDLIAGVVQSDMVAGVIQDLKFVVKNFVGVDENLTGVDVQNELAAGVV